MEDDNVEHIKCLNYNTFRESKVDDISSSSENDMSQVEEDISILKATLNIIWKAFPSMLMIFIFDGILFSNIIFLEHQNNSISISGWGFGLTIINVLILPVSYGVTEGMSCLVSKAYGRKDYESWSVHINQWRYVLLALAILQFIAIIFLEYTMRLHFSIFLKP